MSVDTSQGKRRRGHINGTQNLIYSIYHSAIRNILEEDRTGLNLTDIALRVPQMRDRIVNQPDFKLTPDQLRKLPNKATSDRKTVRKHLLEMFSMGLVRYVDGLYYPIVREEPEIKELRHPLFLPLERPMSKDLIELTDVTLSSVSPQTWSFPLLENGAIFRTYVDPAEFRYRFDDFFGEYMHDFKSSLFCIDQILENAIGSGSLSPRFYNPTKRSLNMKVLREGWTRYFEEGDTKTRVLVWMYAMNPRAFLKFIETVGQEHFKERLATNWEKIVARGKRRLAETRAMNRKRKKVEAFQKKMIDEANAANASRGESG